MSDLQATSDETVETLFEGRRVTLSRKGNQLVLESRAWTAWGWRVASAIMIASVLLLDALLGWLILVKGTSIFVLVLILLVAVLHLGVLWVVIASIYSRRFVFDHDNQICTFSNIPGFGLLIPFSKIDAIDVFVLPSPNMILLGLAHSGNKRRLRLHLFWVNQYSSTELEESLRTITEILSKLLDKPVRKVEKVTLGMTSWR